MKTFNEIQIGDYLYIINPDFIVRPLLVTGVHKVSWLDNTVDFFIKGHKNPVRTKAVDSKTKVEYSFNNTQLQSVTFFSCLEAAQEERSRIKEKYLDEQFRIAKQAFNRIKKVSPKDDRLQKRIIEFFNVNNESI